MDFTLKTYKILLRTLVDQGFSFQTLVDYLSKPAEKSIILRHDVDLLPQNSMDFAWIQSENGIKGSYYFRSVDQSYDERIITEINNLGHEVGYHYETSDTCKGNVDQAYLLFCENLEKMRKLVPIKSICMHGSPLSKYDSRLIWQKYDYRKLGLIGEPYFDIDFNKVLYLTDTGRRWNGDSFNVRDKPIYRKESEGDTKSAKEIFNSFHTTFDIIKSASEGLLPDHILMTFHPQRWSDKPLSWVKELVWQNVKNTGKYFLIKFRK